MIIITRTLAGLWLACCSFQLQAKMTVDDAWLRAPIALSTSVAGYMTIHNQSAEPVTLTGISVAPETAARAGLHQTLEKDGLMSMRPLPLPVKLAADEKLVFMPGGKHIMVSGLKTTLKPGDDVILTLHFSDNTNLETVFTVKSGDTQHDGHQHHD